MVGAAVLPRDRRVNGVRDSKMLTEAEREKLFDRVGRVVLGVGGRRGDAGRSATSWAWLAAQKLAAHRAIEGLGVTPDAAVVDGRWNFVGAVVPHVDRRVKADALCLSVAAASILAKVTRDRYMRAGGRALPALVVRHEQGLPVPGPQGGPAGLRAQRDPPPDLDLHGPLRAVARPEGDPTRAACALLTGRPRARPGPRRWRPIRIWRGGVSSSRRSLTRSAMTPTSCIASDPVEGLLEVGHEVVGRLQADR